MYDGEMWPLHLFPKPLHFDTIMQCNAVRLEQIIFCTDQRNKLILLITLYPKIRI